MELDDIKTLVEAAGVPADRNHRVSTRFKHEMDSHGATQQQAMKTAEDAVLVRDERWCEQCKLEQEPAVPTEPDDRPTD